MNFQEFASLIRFRTKTNSSTFTDTDILMLANVFIDEFAKAIKEVNEDYFGMEYYRDLVADQREYSLPDELQQIKRVDIKIDGSNWIYGIAELDLNHEKLPTEEDDIKNYMAGKKPGYDIFRKSLWLYSGEEIIAVTEGLKLWAIIFPAHFTSLAGTTDMSVDPTSTSHGFPREFHELLARRICVEYKSAQDKPIPLSDLEQKFEQDFQKALEVVTDINLDREVVASVPEDTGFDY